MCIGITLLTLPLGIVPCFWPLFVIINIAIRLPVLIMGILCCPLIFIPPCTCIYPLLFLLVFFRTGEIPEDISKVFSGNFTEDDFSSFNINDLSVFFSSDETNTLGLLSHEGIKARASCQTTLKIKNSGANDLMEEENDKDLEQNVSKVFDESINEILSGSLSDDLDTETTATLSNNIDGTIENDSPDVFNVYFTVSKSFACDEGEFLCDKTFARAHTFVLDTKAWFEEGSNSDSLSSTVKEKGSLSGIEFIDQKNSNMNSVKCDSIEAKFNSD